MRGAVAKAARRDDGWLLLLFSFWPATSFPRALFNGNLLVLLLLNLLSKPGNVRDGHVAE